MALTFDPTVSVGAILTGGAYVFAWVRTRRHDLEDRLKAGADRMDRHDNRITRLEQTVQGLPASGDMHALQIQLTELAGDLKTLSATMEGNNKLLQRLELVVARQEDHLLDGGK